jgi:hypothetical protein
MMPQTTKEFSRELNTKSGLSRINPTVFSVLFVDFQSRFASESTACSSMRLRYGPDDSGGSALSVVVRTYARGVHFPAVCAARHLRFESRCNLSGKPEPEGHLGSYRIAGRTGRRSLPASAAAKPSQESPAKETRRSFSILNPRPSEGAQRRHFLPVRDRPRPA